MNNDTSKRLAIVLALVLFIVSPAFAKKEKPEKLKWKKETEVHSVPDNGATLPLLAVALGSLLIFKFRRAVECQDEPLHGRQIHQGRRRTHAGAGRG